MDASVCPLWINPGNAFRLVVKVASYVTEADQYGVVEMAEQEHELWLDAKIEYSIAQFHDDLKTKIFWGPGQTVSAWVLDDNGSKWKVRRDEHFQQMFKARWAMRCAVIYVDVVRKGDSTMHVSCAGSTSRCVSGVTSGANEGTGPSVVHHDDEGFFCHPPCQKKRELGHPRKNRLKSSKETGGKATRQVMCHNCKEYGHRASSWKCPHTGTKKRKRTKKTKARGEAEEAELRAAEAREAAKIAAREEAQAEEEIVEAMALTTPRRSLFPGDAMGAPVQPKKMQPRRKVLSTKVLKTPEKKKGRNKK